MKNCIAIFGFFILLTFLTRAEAQQSIYDVTPGYGNGLRFWSNDAYKIHMGNSSDYHFGPVTDYSIKANMSTDTGRGWTWGIDGATPVAALNNIGNMQIAGMFIADKIGIGTASPSQKLDVNGNINMAGAAGRRLFMGGYGGSTFGIAFDASYPNYGIFYTEGANDYVSISPNGNANNGTMNIFGDGKVGIGTSAPQTLLNIAHGAGDATVGTPVLRIGGTNNYQSLELGIKGAYDGMISTYGNDLHIYAGNWRSAGATATENHNISFYTSQASSTNWNTAKMYLRYDGNLGIGTVNPEAIVHASGTSWRKLALSTSGTTTIGRLGQDLNGITISANAYFNGGWFRDDVTKPSFALIEHLGNERFEFRVSNPASGNIAWSTAMVITASEKVGIGTASPDEKLTVNGTIHSTRVKVDVTVPGPDYVFEKGYNLLSLDEIKKYIDVNKHLPEVPSAKEMEKNGIDVVEMNMMLLKKIEELTLYIIELKEENEKMKNDFSQKLNSLETMISSTKVKE